MEPYAAAKGGGADAGTGLEESMRRLGLGEDGEAGEEKLPERPGEADCAYYLRTGACGYGERCRYNHPRDRPAPMAARLSMEWNRWFLPSMEQISMDEVMKRCKIMPFMRHSAYVWLGKHYQMTSGRQLLQSSPTLPVHMWTTGSSSSSTRSLSSSSSRRRRASSPPSFAFYLSSKVNYKTNGSTMAKDKKGNATNSKNLRRRVKDAKAPLQVVGQMIDEEEVVNKVESDDAGFIQYTIGDKEGYIKFITNLRKNFNHKINGVVDDIFDDGKSYGAHRVLAEQPSRENPAQWIRIKLVTANKNGKESWTTTLAVRKDNLYVKGFMNNYVTKQEETKGKCSENKGKKKKDNWYELPGISEDDPKLPEKYSAKQLPASWNVKYNGMMKLNDTHQVKKTLESTMMGKAFAERAVRRLSRYHPDDVENKDDNPTRLGLAGLIVMICESARMNPFLDTIAGGWNGGTGLTTRLADIMWDWGSMSAALLYWKRNYYKKWPVKCNDTLGHALASICLVLNSKTVKGSGRARVEILSVVVSAGDVHSIDKITVIDEEGVKHNIYKKNQGDKHEDRCLELIVPEPDKRTSGYEWFNIKFDIIVPNSEGGSSPISITRKWDCLKQEAERETVELVKRSVLSDSGCKLDVTYLVMSNIATEAKVELKLRRRKDEPEDSNLLDHETDVDNEDSDKDTAAAASEYSYTARGTITAHIDGFEKHPIVLFKNAPEGQTVRASDNFLLPLARSDVLVPRGMQLHINTTDLCVTTTSTETCTHHHPKVKTELPRCLSFDIGSSRPQYTDVRCVSRKEQVQVSITWDTEEEKTTEIMKPDVVCMIEDNVENFTKSIEDLRKKLAAHKPFNVHQGDTTIRLTRKRAVGQPPQWIRMRVKAGDHQTTLAIRDDKCYGVGFLNQSGVWYDLGNRRADDNEKKQLPQEYNSVLLDWGLSYDHILGVSDRDWDNVIGELNSEGLGNRSFAEKAVRTLSRYPDVDDDKDEDMNPRVALAGLIIMVCESARFNPLLKYFQDNWDSDNKTETGGFSLEQMKYIWSWGKISRALLLWKDDGQWPQDDQTHILESRGINNEEDALAAVRLVHSDARTLKFHPSGSTTDGSEKSLYLGSEVGPSRRKSRFS